MLKSNFVFLVMFSMSLLLGGGKVLGQQHRSGLPDTSRVGFDRIFVGEPGDTIVVMSRQDSVLFAGGDTIKSITEADIFDTLDFRSFIPGTPYELIEDRLSCMTTEMPLTFNRTVNSFINFFTVRRRNYTQTMLERRDYYFPLFESSLKKYGLPEELKYLSIVESGLNTRAVSRSGAVGLWQFMSATGGDFKLHQNKYTDDRMDPAAATDAACRYLSSLYRQFNNWELALAAYNCGPGAIRRVMRRTGGKTFWEIYHAIPQETRSYVPQFTAVVYAMNYAAQHNIYPDLDSMLRVQAVDTIVLDRQVNLATLARHLDMDPQHMIFYNPQLRQAVSPEEPGFVLKLPTAVADRFRAERFCFLDSSRGEPLPDKPVMARRGRRGRLPSPALVLTSKEPADKAPSGEADDARGAHTERVQLKRHSVRRGETLYTIAAKNQVSVSELKQWNHLHGGKLKTGQRLIVARKIADADKQLGSTPKARPVIEELEAEEAAAANVDDNKAADLESSRATTLVSLSRRKDGTERPATHSRPDSREQTYKVQAGDTLWSISQRYEGVTVQRIIKLNKLKDKNLKPGMKLIIG